MGLCSGGFYRWDGRGGGVISEIKKCLEITDNKHTLLHYKKKNHCSVLYMFCSDCSLKVIFLRQQDKEGSTGL